MLNRLRHLALHPSAEQFCDTYVPEWPNLKVLVSKATANKSAGQKLTHHFKSTFGFSFPRDPQENGVMDHMVRMTTSLRSPFIATATRPLCPSSPPQMGKRRLAVGELMQRHSKKQLEESSLCHRNSCISSISPSVHSVESVSLSCCADTERRGSVLSIAHSGMRTFIPHSVASRRNSIFPSGCIPQIKVTKSSEPTPKKEKKNKKQKGYLEPPKWKYKEAKEEKKKEKKALKEKEEKEKEKKSKDREKRKKEKACWLRWAFWTLSEVVDAFSINCVWGNVWWQNQWSNAVKNAWALKRGRAFWNLSGAFLSHENHFQLPIYDHFSQSYRV